MNGLLFAAHCIPVLILLLMPGPIATLVVASSMNHGPSSGLPTVARASVTNALLLAAEAARLLSFITIFSETFAAVHWLRAGYLIALGIKPCWRHADDPSKALAAPAPRLAHSLLLQSVLI